MVLTDDPDLERILTSSLRNILNDRLPTFLVIKLAAVVEQSIDKLWKYRFPTIAARRLSYEEKLKTLAQHETLDQRSFMDLWKLRNELVHEPSRAGLWRDYDRFEHIVRRFVKAVKSDRRTIGRKGGLSPKRGLAGNE